MKKYVFERFSDDSKRVINQTSVRARMPDAEEAKYTNCCWDGVVAPDGRYYYPLSSENGFCCGTKLGYFDYDQDKVVTCFDSEDVLLYPIRKLDFEDIQVNFPRNVEKMLAQMYPDYMTLPPVEKRRNHFPHELDFGPYAE